MILHFVFFLDEIWIYFHAILTFIRIIRKVLLFISRKRYGTECHVYFGKMIGGSPHLMGIEEKTVHGVNLKNSKKSYFYDMAIYKPRHCQRTGTSCKPRGHFLSIPIVLPVGFTCRFQRRIYASFDVAYELLNTRLFGNFLWNF